MATLAAAEIGMGVLAGASFITKSVESNDEANARTRALQLRMQQEQIAANQNSINRMDAVNRVMASQNAKAGASGNLSSPSFNAVQMDTLDEFSKDENANALNLSFQKQSDEQQIVNTQSNEGAQMGNNLLQTGTSLFNAYVQTSAAAGPSSQWQSAGRKALNDMPEI